MMASTHSPGNVLCEDAREVLSDLLDARRGELPHPDGTRLAEPGLRAAVELHVAGCQQCREELKALEYLGAAFAEFGVGEPPAQQFEDYGRVVRARMAREDGAATAQVAGKRTGRVAWAITFGASALAAASLLLVLTRGLPVGTPRDGRVAEANPSPQPPPKPPLATIAGPFHGVTPMTVMSPNGRRLQAEDFNHDPAQPAGLRGLQDREGRCGYLVFGERTTAGEKPLLGVLLKTTRDVDRVADDRLGLMVYDVVPGSPAHAMGLQRDDYIVTVNDLEVAAGGAEEAVKFLAGIRHLGAGTPLKLQIVRPHTQTGGTSHYLFMEREGTLGAYTP